MRNFGLLCFFSIFLHFPLMAAVPEPPENLEIWTDTQGRELRGRLLRAAGTMIRLRLADGTMPSIPLERFCAADQRRILQWMVVQPAALEYGLEVVSRRAEDGRWQVLVTNRGKNTLPDVMMEAREVRAGGPGVSVGISEQALGRLEPGGRVPLTLPAPLSPVPQNSPEGALLQVRLCRGPAVIWEWSPAGRTLTDWPLREGQVRVPPTGMPPDQVIAALLPVGRSAGTGQVAVPGTARKEETAVTAQEEGEDLVRIFEGP